MMRYYDTTTKNETHTSSDSTIPMTDSRVSGFFEPLKEGYVIEYTADNLPLIVKRPSKTAEEQTEYDALEYARLREADYPSLQDCLHAILDDDLEALQVKRQEVKNRYPKP